MGIKKKNIPGVAVSKKKKTDKDQLTKTATDKYYLLFNSINQGFCIIEMIWNNKHEPVDLRFLEVNTAFEKQTGIKNAVGRTMREIEPGIESHWYETYGKVSKTGAPVHFEEKATALMNRWYNVYAFPLENKSSKVAVLFDDITERKKAEDQRAKAEKTLLETEQKYRAELQQQVEERTIELKESKELLQSIADAIPDMISVQEYPSRKVIYFNREPYTLSGLSADELAKKTIEDRHKLVHPYDLTGLQKYADSFASFSNNDIATVEYRVKNNLNEWIWLSARGKVFERDEKGNVISIVVIVQNINAQKKVEEEIEKHHNILKQAEEIDKMGSWEYNIKTKEFLWSDGMYALFNIEKGKQVKPSIYLDHATEKERDIVEKFVNVIERSFQPLEETIYLKIDGDIKAIKIKAAPLKNNKGEVEKMLGVNKDITASLESQQKIMDLNGSLLSMNKELNFLNSELRSFNSITANNYSEGLRHVYINLETIITSDARRLSDSGRANIRRAQSAVQKMKLLTNDIHNYLELYDARIKKQLISPKINLQNVINEMKGKIEEANAKIEIAELPTLSADPVLFSKLIRNLIDNSIKFKKPGEDTVVTINHITDLNNEFANLAGIPYTVITVTDNGIGFEPTDKVFELFTQLGDQTKHKGSGMGLAMCKKIMEMHDGYIIAEAEPGKGASFHCCFPE